MWTNLKKALLRRYGEKLDKSAAEWRDSMRRMMPGETHADFAAGLRDVVGRNRVSERVWLAQFYRCLDKTTKKLVKQHPKPRTLEEAVDKATEIDYPMENVAQGMFNIGQAWTTASSQFVIPMSGTMGDMNRWAMEGRKDSARILGNSKHAGRMTAVLTIRDDGAKLPILFIIRGVPGGRIEENEFKEYPDEHFYAAQENAWTDKVQIAMVALAALLTPIDGALLQCAGDVLDGGV
ncbi:uncharacterized protein IUM83_17201 [Phytophthora cinnamomi]|uniref:uncharacterized protein n=1 Tax=Phytophthora cinnamomi TaxID=4785 RepID=UPI00355A78D0|nr:hypothetical protein IUM83_17201 [Phytophthora cinnamomi]